MHIGIQSRPHKISWTSITVVPVGLNRFTIKMYTKSSLLEANTPYLSCGPRSSISGNGRFQNRLRPVKVMRWEEGSRPVPGQVINPSPFFFYTHQKNVVVFQNPKNTYFFSLLFMLYSKEHRTHKIQNQIHHQFLFSYKLVGESPFSPTKLLPNKTFGVWILCPFGTT